MPKMTFGNGIIWPSGIVCFPKSANSTSVPRAFNFSTVQSTILKISLRLSGHADTDLIATASFNVSMYRTLFVSTCLKTMKIQTNDHKIEN